MQITQDYPRWKYHRIKKAQIVNSQAEEFALGSDWSNDPTIEGQLETVFAPDRAAIPAHVTETVTQLDLPTKRSRR